MTPKEKAEEIYLKMLKYQHHSNMYIERNIICPTAKNCSLIAVDEVKWFHQRLFYLTEGSIFDKYLQQVKNEIEQL